VAVKIAIATELEARVSGLELEVEILRADVARLEGDDEAAADFADDQRQ